MGATHSELSNFYSDNTDSRNILEISEEVYDRIKYEFEKKPSDAENLNDKVVENQNLFKAHPVEYQPSANNQVLDEIETSLLFQQKEESESYQDEINRHREISHLKTNLDKNFSVETEYATSHNDLKNNESKNILFGFRRTKPCKELEKKLISCYQSNSGYTLACTNEARAFIDCVTNELIGTGEDDGEEFESVSDDDDDDDDD